MALLTLTDVKVATGNTGTTAYDDQLQGFVDAAVPVIEDIVGPVNPATATATRDGGHPCVVLPSAATTVTSVTVDGTLLPSTAWTANLAAGVVYAGSSSCPTYFNYGRQNVVVAYTVGVTTVPANVRLAAIELVRTWWQIGRQGNRPEYAAAPDGDVYTPSGYAVPRRVLELCAPNVRAPGVG